MLYRVTGDNEVSPVPPTTGLSEELLEADLEDWIERHPDVLGEELLVIGRQVAIDSGKDRIDLLALDLQGSTVIVELKRELVGNDADLQAIRYAAMVAGWEHAEVRGQAEAYWASTNQERRTFTQELDDFCDDEYEVNGVQRIVLAGRRVDPRVGTMAVWLRNHDIDIRVVTLELFRDEDRIYLQPQIVIPIPSEESVIAKPKPDAADKEWQRDGRAWHLEQRLSANGRAIVECLVEIVDEAAPDAIGPGWNQKQYIAWRAGSRNWLGCYTDSPNQAAVFVRGLEHVPVDELASQLGWEAFDSTAELADKLALGSSVGHASKGRLRLIMKSAEDMEGPTREALIKLLRLGWQKFVAGETSAPAWQ